MIQPGPETDLAVAKACGFQLDAYEGTGNASTPPFWHNGKPWQPSTDLNDAFLAAEKAGIFPGHLLSQCERNKDWNVWRNEHHFDRDAGEIDDLKFVADGDTPALAICSAILKIAESHK